MNYAKAKQECTANHDVFMQCPYCGWMRPSNTEEKKYTEKDMNEEKNNKDGTCKHEFSLVVEWEPRCFNSSGDPQECPGPTIVEQGRAVKVACVNCTEIRRI